MLIEDGIEQDLPWITQYEHYDVQERIQKPWIELAHSKLSLTRLFEVRPLDRHRPNLSVFRLNDWCIRVESLLQASSKGHLLPSFKPFAVCVEYRQLPSMCRLVGIEVDVTAGRDLRYFVSRNSKKVCNKPDRPCHLP